MENQWKTLPACSMEDTLFVTDLDGTLLNRQGKLKPRAAEMLNHFIENGLQFTYATARGYLSSRRLVSELQLTLPVILMNGAIIADPKTGEHLQITLLSDECLQKAIAFFVEQQESPLVYAIVDGRERVSYLSADTKGIATYLNDRKGDIRFRPCDSYEALWAGDIFYFALIRPKSDFSLLQTTFIQDERFSTNYQEDVYNQNEFWFELFSAGVSKANALATVKQMTGLSRCVAFGDSVNDIPMFQAADAAYAVENAIEALKRIADGILPSNEQMGVPQAIERMITPIYQYTEQPQISMPPDNERFALAVSQALAAETGKGIGTLNEKCTHATLKYYFCADIDHEAKIGGYYADAIGENGIYEVQTASFKRLCKKLNQFLRYCHVTVIYPFAERVQHAYINEKTGELMNKSPARRYRDLTAFFLELYRIKAFLTNPNLTICLAKLEIQKNRYVTDSRCIRKKGQRVDKIPLRLLEEVYLQKPCDYAYFLPQTLPDEFTEEEFCQSTKQNKLLLELLLYTGVIEKLGKRGRRFLYRVTHIKRI